MKSLFQTKLGAWLAAALLVTFSAVAANAQEPSRLQLGSLDHLAAKASKSVDVNVDERLMRLASKVFSDTDAEEREIKKVIAGLKGVYVKVFEFENEGQYSSTDLATIRTQLGAPGWTRLVNVTSKKEGNLEVYLLMNGDMVNGLAVLASDVKELAVVNIVGPVDLDKLAKLEGQFGIPELGIEPAKKTKNDDEK
ncbi:MAG TPA: DUF4252 domain-containing protein [Pyrinomonadaceae bacterium]|jgi:hypothetical protein|nr:DUF4252 domain-containing protein [Pyrinomonadaceae bacterium]